MKAGDILINSIGHKVKVLAVVDDCFLTSQFNRFNEADKWQTKREVNSIWLPWNQELESDIETRMIQVNTPRPFTRSERTIQDFFITR